MKRIIFGFIFGFLFSCILSYGQNTVLEIDHDCWEECIERCIYNPDEGNVIWIDVGDGLQKMYEIPKEKK